MAFAFVKDGSNYANPNTAITVQLLTVTAGNLIVAWFKHEGTPTTYSLSDGTSTFAVGTTENHSNNDMSAGFRYLLSSVASGTVTYTLTLGASRAHIQLVVKEFSYDSTNGAATTDGSNTGQGTGTAAASGTITTTGTAVVAFGGVAQFSSGAASAQQIGGVAASNLEPTGTGADSQGRAFDRIATLSSGAATITIPNDAWICNIVAFKEAAAVGGAVPAGVSTLIMG